MKQLRITVAGQTFDVTVETLGGSNAAPAPAPAAGAGTPIQSPLAGKVVSLDVKPGTAVKEGDQVLTLEAMKMNTVIYAPANGTVTSFCVAPGDTVAENQPLAYLG